MLFAFFAALVAAIIWLAVTSQSLRSDQKALADRVTRLEDRLDRRS